jgi:SAM-dependent methyltransferase
MNDTLIHKAHAISSSQMSKYKDFSSDSCKLTEAGEEFWTGKDVARLPAVYYFKEYIKKHGLAANKLLTFGGKDDIETKLIPHEKAVHCDYWIDKNHDVEDLQLEESDFDFCLINQAFEHLTDINISIKNIKDHLSVGGYLSANFPVVNIPHGFPYNFSTGVTTTYINYLCLQNNLEIIECGAWGNTDYINFIFRELTWPDYTQIDLRNNIDTPCIGWILAKKK